MFKFNRSGDRKRQNKKILFFLLFGYYGVKIEKNGPDSKLFAKKKY